MHSAGDMRVLVSGVLQENGWDKFVATHPDGHHVQSTAWANYLAARGWETIRFRATIGDELVGTAQLAITSVGRLGKVAYLDRGPLLASPSVEVGSVMIKSISEEVRRRGGRALVAQPTSFELATLMADAGFTPTTLGTRLAATVLVDLTLDEDEILARAKSKTRYNIRRALKARALTVREAERSDLVVFHQLLSATAERQGFVSNTVDQLEAMLQTLGDQAKILIAEDEQGPVSAILLIFFGRNVVYKRGAWSGRAGNRHPNELLHWTAMLRAKAAGYSGYDMDGIDPVVARAVVSGAKIPTQALNSVARFKLGFGGEIKLQPDSMIYIPNRALRFGHDRVFMPLSPTRPARKVVSWLKNR